MAGDGDVELLAGGVVHPVTYRRQQINKRVPALSRENSRSILGGSGTLARGGFPMKVFLLLKYLVTHRI